MTGVVFDPSGTRMYFSSQRSYPFLPPPDGAPSEAGIVARGATFEVTGPFRLPEGGVPESWVYGPPAGEGLAGGLSGDVPGLRVKVKKLSLAGVRLSVEVEGATRLHVDVRTFDLEKELRDDGTAHRPLPVTLGRWTGEVTKGTTDVSLGLNRLAARTAILTVVAERPDGRRSVVAEPLTLV
jgi:hypothetical protein